MNGKNCGRIFRQLNRKKMQNECYNLCIDVLDRERCPQIRTGASSNSRHFQNE